MMIPPQQAKILHALARYHTLTSAQLHLLGIGGIRSLRRSLRALGMGGRSGALISRLSAPASPHLGRLPGVHCLTALGRSQGAHGGQLGKASSMAWFLTDYFHRNGIIDFQIRLDLAMASTECDVVEWRSYFEKAQEARSSKMLGGSARTKVDFGNEEWMVPDALFTIRKHGGAHPLVVALELIRGSRVGRSLDQIDRHRRALLESAVARQFGEGEGGSLAVFLFEHDDLLNRVIDRLWRSRRHDFDGLQEYFFFASVEDTKRDVLRCWRRFGDPPWCDFRYSLLSGKPAFRITSV